MKLDLHWIIVFVVLCFIQGIFRPPPYSAALPVLVLQPMLLTRFIDTIKLDGRQEGFAFLIQNELAMLAAGVSTAVVFWLLR